MTKEELIKILAPFPDNTLVLVPSIASEYNYCTIQEVNLRDIEFENSDETISEIKAIVLDEQ